MTRHFIKDISLLDGTRRMLAFRLSGTWATGFGRLAMVAPAVLLLGSSVISPSFADAKESTKRTQASCCTGVKVAEANQTASIERKAVLEPATFAGMASFGYASAKAAPEVMEKLFCYCGCDLTDKHTSLLDCFTSTHGVDCHICQEEAVLALKLHKDGMPIAEIQKTIDDKYTHDYPFQEDTPAYKQYKGTRLWDKANGAKPAASSTRTNANTEVAGPDAGDAPATEHPKLKPGKKVGKCCAAGEHKKSEQK